MEKASVYRLFLAIALLGAAVFGFREVLQYQPGDVGGASSGPAGTLTGKIQIAGTSEFIRDPAGLACKDSQEAAGFTVSYTGPVSGTVLPDKCGPRGPRYSVSLPVGTYELSLTAPAGWRILTTPAAVQIYADFETAASHFVVSRVQGVPEAPTGLRAQCSTTGGEVILSWDKSAAADSYLLRVDSASNNSAAAEDGWFVSTPPDLKADEVLPPYTFGIAMGQRYRFWVHGYDSSGGAGSQSGSQSFICSPVARGPQVTVKAPNGRETWAAGSTQQIRWEQQNVDRVSIGYKTCPSCLGWIVTDLPVDAAAAEGAYSWAIPGTFPLGVNYQIYLIAYKTGFGQASDLSDTTFSIVAP